MNQLESFYKTIIETVHDAIWVSNSDDVIIFANHAMGKLAGLEREQIVGKNVLKDFPRETVREFKPYFNKVRRSLKSVNYEAEVFTPGGRNTIQKGWLLPLTEDGEFSGIICTIQDVTESKKNKQELEESERKYRSLVDLSPDGITTITTTGKVTGINRAFLQFTGYTEEDFVGKHFTEIPTVMKQDFKMFFRYLQEILRIDKNKRFIFNWKHSSGEVRIGDARVKVIRPENERPFILAVIRDITDQRRAELALKESNEQLEATLNALPDILFEVDEDGRIYDYRAPDPDLLYVRPEEFIGCKFANKLPAEAVKKIENGIQEAAKFGVSSSIQYTLDMRGKTYWFEMNASVKKDTVHNKQRFIMLVRNITEQKVAEEELRQSLDEKDFLMKELNHRVKNNLAMILSLISLKNSALGESVDLSDLKNQIDAIRIVHEKLYQSEEIRYIDFRDYVGSLLHTIFSTFIQQSVRIENKVKDINIPTRTAIPLGLIINELATNAIKHGFREDEEAVFSVFMKEKKRKRTALIRSSFQIAVDPSLKTSIRKRQTPWDLNSSLHW